MEQETGERILTIVWIWRTRASRLIDGEDEHLYASGRCLLLASRLIQSNCLGSPTGIVRTVGRCSLRTRKLHFLVFWESLLHSRGYTSKSKF